MNMRIEPWDSFRIAALDTELHANVNFATEQSMSVELAQAAYTLSVCCLSSIACYYCSENAAAETLRTNDDTTDVSTTLKVLA